MIPIRDKRQEKNGVRVSLFEGRMPTISRFYGIVIAMYFDDHNPPHLHARYQGHEATFLISTLEVLEGRLPRRAKALVLEWARLHRGELEQNWERARRAVPLQPIAPLS